MQRHQKIRCDALLCRSLTVVGRFSMRFTHSFRSLSPACYRGTHDEYMGNIRRRFNMAKALGWRIHLTPLYAVAFNVDFIRRSYRQTSTPNASLCFIVTLAVRKSDMHTQC